MMNEVTTPTRRFRRPRGEPPRPALTIAGINAYSRTQPPLEPLPLPDPSTSHAASILYATLTDAGVGSNRWKRLEVLDSLPRGIRIRIKESQDLSSSFNRFYRAGYSRESIIGRLRGLNKVVASHTNLADL